MVDCKITLFSSTREIEFSQSVSGFDTFISQYLEPEFQEGSLTAMGFFAQDDTPGAYSSRIGDTSVEVIKEASDAAENCVLIDWLNHPYGHVVVAYYPCDSSYNINISTDDALMFNVIVDSSGIIKPVNPYRDFLWEYSDVKAITGLGVLGAADSLVAEFNAYLKNTFNKTADELFSASVR